MGIYIYGNRIHVYIHMCIYSIHLNVYICVHVGISHMMMRISYVQNAVWQTSFVNIVEVAFVGKSNIVQEQTIGW